MGILQTSTLYFFVEYGCIDLGTSLYSATSSHVEYCTLSVKLVMIISYSHMIL